MFRRFVVPTSAGWVIARAANHFLISNRDDFGVVNPLTVRASARLFSGSSGHQPILASAAVLASVKCRVKILWAKKERSSQGLLGSSCLGGCSNDKKPPFSQGLAIPERDKLQMKIESRGAISFSWSHAKQIAGEVYKLDVDDVLKERYATLFILASAKWSCSL